MGTLLALTVGLAASAPAQSAPAVTYAYHLLPFDPAQATGADLLALAHAQAAQGFSLRGVQTLAEGPYALFRRTDDPALPHARKVKLVAGPTLAPDQRAATFVANLNRYGARGFAVLDAGLQRLADGVFVLLERDVAGGVVPALDYAADLLSGLDPAPGRIDLTGADFLAGAGSEGAQGYALYQRFSSQTSTPDFGGPHVFFLFERALSPAAPARTVGFRLDAHPDPTTLTAAAFLQRLNKRGKKGFSLRTILPLADGDYDVSERALDADGRRGTYAFTAEATAATPAAAEWEALLNAHGARGERFDLRVNSTDGPHAIFYSFQPPATDSSPGQ